MTTGDQMSADTDPLFWTGERAVALEAKLDPKLTAQRDAFDGGRRKLTYLEGHAVIAQLNRIFGYGGWSYTLDEMGVDEWCEGPAEDWYAEFYAVVTLRVGGASRQDVGTAEVRNTKRTEQRSGEVLVRNNVRNVDSRATARKGAVTDALKRAARTFGQQFGNGLYDADDNIFAWMAAHSLDDGDAAGEPSGSSNGGAERVAARAPGPKAAPRQDQGARPPTSKDAAEAGGNIAQWTQQQLGARIREMAGVTLHGLAHWQNMARTYGVPVPARGPDMTQEWLLALYQAINARRWEERIRLATSEQEVTDARAHALSERDKRGINAEQYTRLYDAAEARYAELAGPLTAQVV